MPHRALTTTPGAGSRRKRIETNCYWHMHAGTCAHIGSMLAPARCRVSPRFLVDAIQLRCLRLLQTLSEPRFVPAHDAIGIDIAADAHTGILACGEMLAGAIAIAVVVHAEVAHARSGVRGVAAPGFDILVGAPIQIDRIDVDQA